MKAFHFRGGVPYVLEVLDLGATDEDEGVRAVARVYAEQYALVDLEADPVRYGEWRLRSRDLTRGAVLARGVRELAVDLRNSTDRELAERLAATVPTRLDIARGAGVDLPRIMRDEGAAARILSAAERDDPRVASAAIPWTPLLGLTVQEAEVALLPHVRSQDPELMRLALSALLEVEGSWVAEAMVRELEAAPERWTGAAIQSAGLLRALVDRGDPAAIPSLVRLLADHEGTPVGDAIALRALAPLASFDHHQPESAPWWQAWCARNLETHDSQR